MRTESSTPKLPASGNHHGKTHAAALYAYREMFINIGSRSREKCSSVPRAGKGHAPGGHGRKSAVKRAHEHNKHETDLSA